jgi:hypothetical protein
MNNEIAEELNNTTWRSLLCQFQPNQNRENKNECSYGLVSITQKYQIPSSSMAVTSCHYFPPTSPTMHIAKYIPICSKFQASKYRRMDISSFYHISQET